MEYIVGREDDINVFNRFIEDDKFLLNIYETSRDWQNSTLPKTFLSFVLDKSYLLRVIEFR